MKAKRIISVVTIATVVVYVGLIVGWHLYSPTKDFEMQVPGADNRPEASARKANDVKIGEFFMRYDEAASSLTGKWSSFRGESSTNIIKTSDKIDISQEDFPELWSVETGEGHAAPVIFNGYVYFLDYDEGLSSDALRCFSLESGKELWRRWYRVPMKRNHGFSRTVPVVSETYIITIGPLGHVMCCDPATGDLKWTLDMRQEYNTDVPFWYAGQCPIVDGNTLILAPAGEHILLTGINCETGEVVWETPNSIKYKMSHSSVMPMTIEGKKTYVYMGIGGVCGVSAEKEDSGTLLWDVSKWQPSVIAPSPLQLSGNTILLVAGYGSGGAVLRVDRNGTKWDAKITDQYKANEGLACEQQTPILYNNMIITVMPNDGGSLRGKLVSYSPSNVRNPIWSSGADERFGYGPYIIINEYVFVFKEDGELYVYEIKQNSMTLLKKQLVIEDGADAWGPIAYADGRLLLRDAHKVICLKIN